MGAVNVLGRLKFQLPNVNEQSLYELFQLSSNVFGAFHEALRRQKHEGITPTPRDKQKASMTGHTLGTETGERSYVLRNLRNTFSSLVSCMHYNFRLTDFSYVIFHCTCSLIICKQNEALNQKPRT